MGRALLHQFTTHTQWCYATHLVRGQQDTLGVLSRRQLINERAEQHWIAELTLIDLHQRHAARIIAYNCERMIPSDSPESNTRTLVEDALLCYDPLHHRWVMVQLEYPRYQVGMRTLKEGENGSLALSPLCLLQRDKDWGGMNPLLDLDVHTDCYQVLSHLRFMDHLSVPRIWRTDLTVWEAWDPLAEARATERAGDAPAPSSWQEWLHRIDRQEQQILTGARRQVDRIFLPEQVTFDPQTTLVSQTSDVEILRQGEVMEAEMAFTIADGSTRLLALCSPEIRPDEEVSEEERATWPAPPEWYITLPLLEEARLAPPQWHIWLTAWDRESLRYKWVYTPRIGTPAEDLPQYEHPFWPAAYIAALAGPTTAHQEPTFVAVLVLSSLEKETYLFPEHEESNDERASDDEEEESDASEHEEEHDEGEEVEEVEIVWGKPYGEIQSCAVCLTHEGQIVQEIYAAFGLRPSLCRCSELVIGVDQLAEGWRLWNWAATQESRLRTIVPLDPTCRHAFVCAEAESPTFWLIEQLSDAVRVSRRNAATLAAVSEAEVLAGATLTFDEVASFSYSSRRRPLDPQRNPGLIAYGETLLLLVFNQQGEMQLYHVQ